MNGAFKKPFQLTAHRGRTAAALGLMLTAAVVSACSSSSSSSFAPAAPAGPASTTGPVSAAPAGASGASGSPSAVAEITSSWDTFFSSSTPNSRRVQLLQNGTQFTSALSAFASSPLASAVTTKVDSVTLTSKAEATVKYDLTAMGTPVATGATGTSVLQDGTWKLSDAVFCGLLTQANTAGLTLPVPAACGSAS